MEYKHFSHEHTVTLCQVQQGQRYRCNGCQTYCHDSIYACWKCNFFLHEHCGNANRYVKHPSHTLHPLILMPTPTYCSGSFVCNACGVPGNSFSYCCALCEIDLHVNCAFLPLKVTHKAHEHELFLSVAMPDNKDSPEHCKLCTKEIDSKRWSFVCAISECDFRLHTFCATTEVKPGIFIDDGPETEVPDTSNVNDSKSESSQPQPQPEPGLTAENVAELYQLQLQMQMAEQLAQMIASFNLSSLAP